MRYTINPTDKISISLIENDYVKSILQNIYLLLNTVKGSVPMYRGFGIDSAYIDRPLPAAKALLTLSIKEAIEKYEKRAKFIDVSYEYDENIIGKLIPIPEVYIDE